MKATNAITYGANDPVLVVEQRLIEADELCTQIQAAMKLLSVPAAGWGAAGTASMAVEKLEELLAALK